MKSFFSKTLNRATVPKAFLFQSFSWISATRFAELSQIGKIQNEARLMWG